MSDYDLSMDEIHDPADYPDEPPAHVISWAVKAQQTVERLLSQGFTKEAADLQNDIDTELDKYGGDEGE